MERIIAMENRIGPKNDENGDGDDKKVGKDFERVGVN